MQAIGVFLRRDGRDGGVLVQALGERELEQDAVDCGIGVERAEEVDQLPLGQPLGIEAIARGDAHGVGRTLLVPDVDLARREIADEHDTQRRRHATLGAQALDAGADARQHLLGYRFALEDHAPSGVVKQSDVSGRCRRLGLSRDRP